jgi:deoxyribodipyrimidine photolyase-related protein
MRNLVLVLGDQLDAESAAFDDFDPKHDAVWMAEVDEETTHVWCHKLRIVMFLAAMRHFRDGLTERGFAVHYTEMPVDPKQDRGAGFAEVLAKDVRRLKPQRLIVCEPGDFRVRQSLEATAKTLKLPLEIRADRHFYDSIDSFRDWSKNRKSLLLETYYRHMRKTHDVLMTPGGEPEGGAWNLDHENRDAFSRKGPPASLQSPRRFRPDGVTQGVIDMVAVRFADHPGSLEHMTLPVTRSQALAFLNDFIENRLPDFGRWEDAMWTGQPFLYHSRLSVPLNLKLLHPRECVKAAIAAYHSGHAPLNSVEGFVRQILGWREFVRGIYWKHMPDYLEHNHLDQQERLPQFFWDGNTDMECARQAMRSVLDHGYAHHIQRLMVLGNLAQTYGVHPVAFHEWHMAMYLDAVDWVSLPNTLGMSQYGDGGIMATKPYCASGNYIHKMSNYCRNCRYDYRKSHGEDACPVSTFYWDFLDRNRERLDGNNRMAISLKNLERRIEKDPEEFQAIRRRAEELRREWS